jgi:hypothetical protein
MALQLDEREIEEGRISVGKIEDDNERLFGG